MSSSDDETSLKHRLKNLSFEDFFQLLKTMRSKVETLADALVACERRGDDCFQSEDQVYDMISKTCGLEVADKIFSTRFDLSMSDLKQLCVDVSRGYVQLIDFAKHTSWYHPCRYESAKFIIEGPALHADAKIATLEVGSKTAFAFCYDHTDRSNEPLLNLMVEKTVSRLVDVDLEQVRKEMTTLNIIVSQFTPEVGRKRVEKKFITIAFKKNQDLETLMREACESCLSELKNNPLFVSARVEFLNLDQVLMGFALVSRMIKVKKYRFSTRHINEVIEVREDIDFTDEENLQATKQALLMGLAYKYVLNTETYTFGPVGEMGDVPSISFFLEGAPASRDGSRIILIKMQSYEMHENHTMLVHNKDEKMMACWAPANGRIGLPEFVGVLMTRFTARERANGRRGSRWFSVQDKNARDMENIEVDMTEFARNFNGVSGRYVFRAEGEEDGVEYRKEITLIIAKHI